MGRTCYTPGLNKLVDINCTGKQLPDNVPEGYRRTTVILEMGKSKDEGGSESTGFPGEKTVRC